MARSYRHFRCGGSSHSYFADQPNVSSAGNLRRLHAHMVVIEHRDRLSVAHQSWRDCVCNWLRSVAVCAVGTASSAGNPMLFWFLLTLVIPYVAIRFRSDCDSCDSNDLVTT